MTRTVVWSRSALDDLRAQVTHIAADDPAAARRVAGRVREATEALAAIPTGRPGRVAGTYEKSVSRMSYVIAYAVLGDTEDGTVAILRVIHTARDWPAGAWPKG